MADGSSERGDEGGDGGDRRGCVGRLLQNQGVEIRWEALIANRPCMAISRESKVVVDGMVVTGVYHDEIDTELTAIATETVGWAMPIFGSLRNTPASGYRYRIYSGAISSHARMQLIQITNPPQPISSRRPRSEKPE